MVLFNKGAGGGGDDCVGLFLAGLSNKLCAFFPGSGGWFDVIWAELQKSLKNCFSVLFVGRRLLVCLCVVIGSLEEECKLEK